MTRPDLGIIAGADACRIGKRIGWAVVELRVARQVEVYFEQDLAEYFDRSAPIILGVDIPIGLPEKGQLRQADVEAKALLGSRSSTVFHTPPRQVLTQPTYADARGIAPVSAQAYALRSRIFEVETLAHLYGGRVIEIHPEVSFLALSGRPLAPKKSWNGIQERIAILMQEGIDLRDSFSDDAGLIPPDDILDAAVAALTALQVSEGTGRVLPAGFQGHRQAERELIWMPQPVR